MLKLFSFFYTHLLFHNIIPYLQQLFNDGFPGTLNMIFNKMMVQMVKMMFARLKIHPQLVLMMVEWTYKLLTNIL